MRVILDLPDSIAPTASDPAPAILEAVALQAYAQRRISQGKLAEALDRSVFEVDQLLAERGILRPFTAEDIGNEMAAIRELG